MFLISKFKYFNAIYKVSFSVILYYEIPNCTTKKLMLYYGPKFEVGASAFLRLGLVLASHAH